MTRTRQSAWVALALTALATLAAPSASALHNPTGHIHDPTWSVCSNPDGDTGCSWVAVSGTGEAFCWYAGCVAVSGTGDTECRDTIACAAASGTDDAYGIVALSATGDAHADGDSHADENRVALSVMGDAGDTDEGTLVAVSLTGDAEGTHAVSGCDTAADQGVDRFCTDAPADP